MKKYLFVMITIYSCQGNPQTGTLGKSPQTMVVTEDIPAKKMYDIDFEKTAWPVIASMPIENRQIVADITFQKIIQILKGKEIDQKTLTYLLLNLYNSRVTKDISGFIFILNDDRFSNKNGMYAIKNKHMILSLITSRFLIQYRQVVRDLILNSNDRGFVRMAVRACGTLLDKACLPYIKKFREEYPTYSNESIAKKAIARIESGILDYSFIQDKREAQAK